MPYVALPSSGALSPRRSIDPKSVHGLDACCICTTPRSAFTPSTRVSTEQPQTQKFAHASAPHATLPLVTTLRTSFKLRAQNAPAATSHPHGWRPSLKANCRCRAVRHRTARLSLAGRPACPAVHFNSEAPEVHRHEPVRAAHQAAAQVGHRARLLHAAASKPTAQMPSSCP